MNQSVVVELECHKDFDHCLNGESFTLPPTIMVSVQNSSLKDYFPC